VRLSAKINRNFGIHRIAGINRYYSYIELTQKFTLTNTQNHTRQTISRRHLLRDYTKVVPTILEIPSKDIPYDPEQDTVMERVALMLGGVQ